MYRSGGRPSAGPEGVLVYEIDGPLFFGTAQKFEQAVERSGAEFKVLIIRMRKMIYLDAGGINTLHQVWEMCSRRHVQLIISGIHTQPYTLLHKSGYKKCSSFVTFLAWMEVALNHRHTDRSYQQEIKRMLYFLNQHVMKTLKKTGLSLSLN